MKCSRWVQTPFKIPQQIVLPNHSQRSCELPLIMAVRVQFLAILEVVLLILVFGGSGAEQLVYTQGTGQKTWCVAKPSSDDGTLSANLNYACSQVDCGIIQKGCPCFLPDKLINRASVAMNLYYQAHGRNTWNCNFRDSGLIVLTDPSYGNCVYA